MKQLDVTLSLIDKFSRPLKQATGGLKGLTKGMRGHTQDAGAGAAGIWATTQAIGGFLGPAYAMKNALNEVGSLGVGQKSLNELSDAAIKFTMEFGGSADDVVRSAYDIQSAISGLSGKELSDFTVASGILAKATKADTGTITSYMGTMYGIFQKQADAMGRSAWVEQIAGQTAEAARIFKSDGVEMSGAFTALGAAATSMGVDVAEQMGILGQLQSTMSGSEAGTKFKSFLAGVGGAQKDLGLSFTNKDGTMKSVTDILELIKGKYGDLSKVADSDLLKKAFGSDEAVAMIKLLITNTDSLKGNIEAIGKIKSMEEVTKMAKKMTATGDRLKAVWNGMVIILGRTLLPILDPLLEKFAAIGMAGAKWLKMFPNIARVIGVAVLAMLSLAAITAAVTLAMAVAGIISTGFALVLTFLDFVAGVLTAVLWGLAGALYLVTSPIGLIIIAIIALIAGIWYLIANWKECLAWLKNTEAFIWLMGVITQVTEFFKSAWASIAAGWQAVLEFFTTNSPLEIFTAAASAIGNVFAGMWETLKGTFSATWDWIVEKLNKLPGIEIPATISSVPQPVAIPTGVAPVPEPISSTSPLAPLAPISTGRGGIGGQLTQKSSNADSSRSMTIGAVHYNVANPMTPQALAENAELYGYGG